jgi:hypothetical protein
MMPQNKLALVPGKFFGKSNIESKAKSLPFGAAL